MWRKETCLQIVHKGIIESNKDWICCSDQLQLLLCNDFPKFVFRTEISHMHFRGTPRELLLSTKNTN